MNGPRYWLPNSTTGTLAADERTTFGDLEMRLLATVDVGPNQVRAPYTETTVLRTTTFFFERGEEIYELTSPEGVVYVMQSMSQIADPDLTLADLPNLGARLMLPDGWAYTVRTLDEDLVLAVQGAATVIQDDLSNTYQRATPDPAASPTPTPGGNPLPILADGTGTPCRSDAQCQGLEASHCLLANGFGYCTVEGCESSGCGAPCECCFGCSDFAAPFLPFTGSACLPAGFTRQLTEQAGCTCAAGGAEPNVTCPPTTPTAAPATSPTPTATATPANDERI